MLTVMHNRLPQSIGTSEEAHSIATWKATQSIPHEAIANAHLRYVLLQWKKEEPDGAEKVVLNTLSPRDNAKVES